MSHLLNAISGAEPGSDIIIWMESPSNPLCQIIDIEAVCLATEEMENVTTVVDGTMTTPILTRPIGVRLFLFNKAQKARS